MGRQAGAPQPVASRRCMPSRASWAAGAAAASTVAGTGTAVPPSLPHRSSIDACAVEVWLWYTCIRRKYAWPAASCMNGGIGAEPPDGPQGKGTALCTNTVEAQGK